MCGISAVIGSVEEEQINKMAAAIQHRGTETVLYTGKNILLAYNWLKITDEKATHDVFSGESGCCLLNGYISNYKELALKYDIDLTSNCDSELLYKFLCKFGSKKLHELNGFFAVVFIHERYPEGIIFTDRYGIKQLYKYHQNGVTYICSEIKGIKAIFTDLEPNPLIVADWKHSLGVMSRDNTIYKGVYRVRQLPFNRPQKIAISYEDAVEKLHLLWTQSYLRNVIYDQPTGVFLSGGIDSGIVAKRFPCMTFSMDYVDKHYSEYDLIKKNLNLFPHYTMICDEGMAAIYKDKAAKIMDDPRVASCYTNYALTELASKFCKVIYSGAGGDEVFGGYAHRNNKDIYRVIKRTNYPPEGNYGYISHDEYNWLYLQGVLTVEDRIASHFTMETRYPLLDNDFVDFALSLPDEYLKDKKILKEIAGLHPDVSTAPKKGWSNPYMTNDEWVELVLKEQGIS